jgi:hypothetical protein
MIRVSTKKVAFYRKETKQNKFQLNTIYVKSYLKLIGIWQ